MTNTPPDDREPGKLRRNLFRLHLYRNSPRTWWAMIGGVVGMLVAGEPSWVVLLAASALTLYAMAIDRANVDALQTARAMRAVRRATATEQAGPTTTAGTTPVGALNSSTVAAAAPPDDWPQPRDPFACLPHGNLACRTCWFER